MTTDQKTLVRELLSLERSDLFTFRNITKSVKLINPNSKELVDSTSTESQNVESEKVVSVLPLRTVKSTTVESEKIYKDREWYAVTEMLPLDFYRIIESIPNMYTVEKFDIKYIRNPKKCAYDRYGTTNMWRPLMILNRCPSINNFNFEYIRYFNIEKFSSVMSILMSRMNYYNS